MTGGGSLANLRRSAGMSMQGDGSRRNAGGAAVEPRGRRPAVVRLPLWLILCLLAAGCGSIGPIGPNLGPSARARDVSVAFESIDGLPRDVSQRLVRDLNEEAAALQIAVVPAGGEPAYRMRGYLAAHAERAGTSIAWAWDVYDAELRRAFRLSGEEPAGAAARGRPGKNPAGSIWASADEALLRRIARAGMEQLAALLGSAPATPAPASPERNGAAVASRDDVRPVPDETAAALDSGAVPLPHRRPVLAGLAGTDRLADAAAGR
jgi:hypothetical protein